MIQVEQDSWRAAYHCDIADEGCAVACRTALLPLKTTIRGPAPPCEPDKDDIIDRAIYFFKANCMMKNFEMESHGDRTLVYATLFISQIISRLSVKKPQSKEDGKKLLYALAMEDFTKPGDAGFPITAFFEAPKSRDESELWRTYMKQMREEITQRMLDKCFNNEGKLSKYWVDQFVKRKFMNKTLGN